MKDINSIINKAKNHQKYINGASKTKASAIIIPLINISGDVNVLFEVRSKKLKSQPGDICFPGGRIENGETAICAAKRELYEELGIDEHNIEIINELDTFVRYDGMIIHPFLGIVNSNVNVKLSPNEVDHYFYVPIEYFIKNKPERYYSDILVKRKSDFPFERINGGENYKFKTGIYETLFYKYQNYNIWGITAAILNNFLEII
ncbi:NUDIX hydrolase [Clostridium sp. HCP1S3_B4]|uniref:NUDIX hydrolase n=1 Tax=unclassified Clostridium TaxID=2614128 RepID=UPI0016B69A2F|nr:CoA pyrophosphatase [Clostridium sp.]NLK24600.1 CoA pyrophosphatase [Clostridiales bacterium]